MFALNAALYAADDAAGRGGHVGRNQAALARLVTGEMGELLIDKRGRFIADDVTSEIVNEHTEKCFGFVFTTLANDGCMLRFSEYGSLRTKGGLSKAINSLWEDDCFDDYEGKSPAEAFKSIWYVSTLVEKRVAVLRDLYTAITQANVPGNVYFPFAKRTVLLCYITLLHRAIYQHSEWYGMDSLRATAIRKCEKLLNEMIAYCKKNFLQTEDTTESGSCFDWLTRDEGNLRITCGPTLLERFGVKRGKRVIIKDRCDDKDVNPFKHHHI